MGLQTGCFSNPLGKELHIRFANMLCYCTLSEVGYKLGLKLKGKVMQEHDSPTLPILFP